MLSAAAQVDIWEAVKGGARQADVASDFGISAGRVSQICKKFRLAEERGEARMAGEKIVAGDKKNGQLCSCKDNPKVYIGSCRTKDGKLKRKRFYSDGIGSAEKQWEEWKAGVRDKELEDDGPEPFAKEPEPVEQTEEGVTFTEPVESEEFFAVDVPDVAYLLMSVLPTVKPYGLFKTEDEVLAKLEEMGRVIDFLESGVELEVFEVGWE